MKLRNADTANVPSDKLRDYLLSRSHPIGRFKSMFFRSLGYDLDNHEVLDRDIRSLVSGDAEESETNEFGTKYLVHGALHGPNGNSADIVTVWIILAGEDIPRFVTAYPED